MFCLLFTRDRLDQIFTNKLTFPASRVLLNDHEKVPDKRIESVNIVTFFNMKYNYYSCSSDTRLSVMTSMVAWSSKIIFAYFILIFLNGLY